MISHFHKTIFIHIPKCGGQSIETAFLNDLGLTWETRAPLLLRPNDNPRIGPPRLAHLRAKEYTKFHYISEELYETYYKFSIVRHPVERAISTFNYLKIKDRFGRMINWSNFLNIILPQKLSQKDFFFLP